MAGFNYVLGDEAVRTFTVLSARQREKLLRVLDMLAKYPTEGGDYQETGASGRSYEVRLCDDLLITWWVDHASREVRVVRLEHIE